MESAGSWVLIPHYIFGHLHSLTSLLGWGLCSVLKVQSWGTQTLKSQKRHIILIYIFFRHLMYGCPLFPESASCSFWAFATLFLLPWMCSAYISTWRMPTPPLRSCSHHFLFEAFSELPQAEFPCPLWPPHPRFCAFQSHSIYQFIHGSPQKHVSLSLHNLSIMCSPRAGTEFYSTSNLLCPE